jgi:Tfp pilus assembly protein PilF
MNRKAYVLLVCILFAAGTMAQTLKDAIKLTESEQFDLATSAFERLVSSPTATGTEYFYFGENYLLSDEKDSARIIFTKGLAADPNNVLNTIGLAKIELDNGNPDKGKKMIDDAIVKAGPKNVTPYIEAADALVHFKTKDLDKATQLLDKAVTLDPKNPDIHILYGDIYSERNNGTAAAEKYNKALDWTNLLCVPLFPKASCTNDLRTMMAPPKNTRMPLRSTRTSPLPTANLAKLISGWESWRTPRPHTGNTWSCPVTTVPHASAMLRSSISEKIMPEH